jgi:hypothetical protein
MCAQFSCRVVAVSTPKVDHPKIPNIGLAGSHLCLMDVQTPFEELSVFAYDVQGVYVEGCDDGDCHLMASAPAQFVPSIRFERFLARNDMCRLYSPGARSSKLLMINIKCAVCTVFGASLHDGI